MKTAPLRMTKSEQELADDLRTLPAHLARYFDSVTSIEAGEVEMHEVRGLSRRVTIVTPQDELAVDKCVARGLDIMDLYGDKLP